MAVCVNVYCTSTAIMTINEYNTITHSQKLVKEEDRQKEVDLCADKKF